MGVIRVADRLETLLRERHEKFNDELKETHQKEINFTDFTDLISRLEGLDNLEKITIQPLKKGRRSKKLDFVLGILP